MAKKFKIKERKALTNAHPYPLLQVTELSHGFGGQTVLNNLSLELYQGEVVLLRGANGSGKTTLLNILTGNLEPHKGKIELFTNGQTQVFKFPLSKWQKLNPFNHFTPEQMAEQQVGRTWQDIRLFKTQSLQDNIAVATPQQLGENPFNVLFRRGKVRQQEAKIRQVSADRLAQLGLSGREQSSADKVSLGQSKRVAISRAVQAGVKILFLDEPLAGLDGDGIGEVMGLLRQLVYQGQVTLVIVEHIFNIPHILDLATTVWTLEGGQVKRETPETITLSASSEERTGMGHWLGRIKGENGTIEERLLSGGAILTTVQPEGSELGEVLLEVEDLVVYRGKRLVIGAYGEKGTVEGLSFCLRRGELAVLQAPNGWGKTTLLEAISGVIPLKRGVIRLQGKPIEKLPVWERVRLGLSLLQARDNGFPSLTVKEVLSLAKVEKLPSHLKGLGSKRMSDLSGGEKQRVILTTFLSQRQPLVKILDEPFSALDLAGLQIPWQMVKPKNKLQQTCLIAIPSSIEEE